jgi:hypothetical protein
MNKNTNDHIFRNCTILPFLSDHSLSLRHGLLSNPIKTLCLLLELKNRSRGEGGVESGQIEMLRIEGRCLGKDEDIELRLWPLLIDGPNIEFRGGGVEDTSCLV